MLILKILKKNLNLAIHLQSHYWSSLRLSLVYAQNFLSVSHKHDISSYQGSIEGISKDWNLSETFVGLILLPIVGNAAGNKKNQISFEEHVTAVSSAMKNKMDLTLGVALGSSMQIALLVTPVVVLVGWIIDIPMTLQFTVFETVVLFVSVYVVGTVISDGSSNWLEGAMLLAMYLMIAIALYCLPM